ncbi:MAG: histidine kinase [Bacteroidales bacterium]|nr:histidine kinase [Bacteroidales bacterium]
MELSITRNKHNFFTILRALLFLLLISSAITFLFVGKDFFVSFKRYIDGILYGFSIGLTFWLGNWAIGWLSGTRLNWKKNPRRANTISLLSFLVYGIIASITIPFLFHGVFHNRWNGLFNTVIVNGFINLSLDIIFVSIYYTKYLVKYYEKSLVNEEVFKRESLLAKYEALKNQVNPHFLFNSLNTLSGVVENDPAKAVGFIKKLSDIYRYVLEQRDKEVVMLNDEMKFVSDYLHLAKIRYGNGLTIKNTIGSTTFLVAPLGLQMLVENAIKHNIIGDDMPLTIELSVENGFIIIKNNLQRKHPGFDTSSLGLENLKNRYQYITEKPVEIIESLNSFIVKLPVIENNKQ